LACGEPNVIDATMHTGKVEPSSGDGRIAVWGTFLGLGFEQCLQKAHFLV